MTRRRQRSTRPHQGMTLLEVMLAMFILVMVFGAALSSVVHVASTVAAAKNRTRAVAILNLQMEEMRAMSFSDFAGGSTSPFASAVPTEMEPVKQTLRTLGCLHSALPVSPQPWTI